MTAEPPSLELAFDLSMRRAGTEFRFAAALSEPVTAVIGRSGSGKTTLARLLAGFERPEAGFLSIGGADVVRVDEGVLEPPERRGIGFVFQTHRVFPHLTVRENLGFAVRRCGRRSRLRVEEIASRLRIAHLLDRCASELSGSEAQRTSLGRAILSAERLLILDEPLASLDPRLREEMLDCLGELPGFLDVPMIFITHSPEEARRLASSALLISGGRVVFHGGLEAALSHSQYVGDTQ